MGESERLRADVVFWRECRRSAAAGTNIRRMLAGGLKVRYRQRDPCFRPKPNRAILPPGCRCRYGGPSAPASYLFAASSTGSGDGLSPSFRQAIYHGNRRGARIKPTVGPILEVRIGPPAHEYRGASPCRGRGVTVAAQSANRARWPLGLDRIPRAGDPT
jgi:hypothetical protein